MHTACLRLSQRVREFRSLVATKGVEGLIGSPGGPVLGKRVRTKHARVYAFVSPLRGSELHDKHYSKPLVFIGLARWQRTDGTTVVRRHSCRLYL